MIQWITKILFRGKLRKASFHILTWDMQGAQPDWKLLDEEAMNCQTGYPPDLICFQNVPFSVDGSQEKGFVDSLPSSLSANYYLQGPVIEGNQSFVTLVRRETIYCDPLYAEPAAPVPIHTKGKLIGIKTCLRLQAFPRTSLSICNCNLTEKTAPDDILLIQNEKICLIAGMFVLDGHRSAWPAMGVLNIRSFKLTAATCPACCAPGMPSSQRILYYSAGSGNKDTECELWGRSWEYPSRMESGLTNLGKAVFGNSILQVSPEGWDSKS